MYPNPPSSDPDILMSAPDIPDVSDISAAPPRAFDTPDNSPPGAGLGAGARKNEEQECESNNARTPVVGSAPPVASPVAPPPSPPLVDNIMSTVDVVDIVDIS